MYGDFGADYADLTSLNLEDGIFKVNPGSGFFSFALAVFTIVCLWRVFVKAGKPGWAALIPVYNLWVLLEIAGMKGALVLLILIPILGWLVVVILELVALFKLAKRFGKSDGFGVGLVLLSTIFMAILAFDNKIVYKK